jgi:DivIVA domain-containing protein
MWFFGLIVVLLIGAVAVVASGRWGGMSAAYDDRPDVSVPARDVLTADDLARARFGVALRGYRMDEVDALLERLAREIAERDRRIADLERAVSPIVAGPGGVGFTSTQDYDPTDFDDTGYQEPILVGGDFPEPADPQPEQAQVEAEPEQQAQPEQQQAQPVQPEAERQPEQQALAEQPSQTEQRSEPPPQAQREAQAEQQVQPEQPPAGEPEQPRQIDPAQPSGQAWPDPLAEQAPAPQPPPQLPHEQNGQEPFDPEHTRAVEQQNPSPDDAAGEPPAPRGRHSAAPDLDVSQRPAR